METARAVARGDAEAEAVAVGQRVAPAGARLQVVTEGGLIRVTARADVPGPGGVVGGLGGVTLEATAVAQAEADPAGPAVVR
ncbi:MAG: TadE family type IV pilus minor pilin [Nocardioides sp.]